jgi:erythromycin esterase
VSPTAAARAVGSFALVLASCVGRAGTEDDERRAFVTWAASSAVPVSARAIEETIGAARVVAFGEAGHGVEEALRFRNELLHRLVEGKGYSGIAMETGYAESLRIDEYVAGGPGDAAEVARRSFTSGFGNFGANVDLIVWMRDHNRSAKPERRLRFFGVDLSLGGPMGSSATAAPVECALNALQRHAPDDAKRLRLAFSSGVGGAVSEQRGLSPADAAAYAAFAGDLLAAARKTGDVPAVQCATTAVQAGEVERVAPQPAPGGVPPDAWRTLEARDLAMADNVLWALGQLGPGGKLLVFAHDSHVMNAARRGGHLSRLTQAPRAMGQKLRDALGGDLVIVAEAAPGTKGSSRSEEFGDVLRTARPAPFLLDLRSASGASRAWLTRTHRLRINGDSEAVVEPATAFDAVIVQAEASPAEPIGR